MKLTLFIKVYKSNQKLQLLTAECWSNSVATSWQNPISFTHFFLHKPHSMATVGEQGIGELLGKQSANEKASWMILDDSTLRWVLQ